MSEVTLKEFEEILDFTIQNGLHHSVMGLGAPGLGKSQIVARVAEKYGYHLEDLRLAQMSEVEIGGLIYPDKDARKTEWLKPNFFPEENGPKTILLLDEITSANKRVQVAAYQLVLDRKIGRHKLPDSTIIVALGNREDDNGVFVQLAAPLADRFTILDIKLDADVWLRDYAMNPANSTVELGAPGNKKPYTFNALVAAFIQAKPESLHTQAQNPDAMVFATPRSWTKVSDIMNLAGVTGGQMPASVKNMIYGIVDETSATEFIGFCEDNREIQIAKDILAGNSYQVPSDRSSNIFLISSVSTVFNQMYNKEPNKEALTPQCVNMLKYFVQLEPELTSMGLDNIKTIDSVMFSKVLHDNQDEFIAYRERLSVFLQEAAEADEKAKLEAQGIQADKEEDLDEDIFDGFDFSDNSLANGESSDFDLDTMDLFGDEDEEETAEQNNSGSFSVTDESPSDLYEVVEINGVSAKKTRDGKFIL